MTGCPFCTTSEVPFPPQLLQPAFQQVIVLALESELALRSKQILRTSALRADDRPTLPKRDASVKAKVSAQSHSPLAN